MSSGWSLGSLRHLDAYPKTNDDFRVRTLAGAAVSTVSILFILFLVVSEFSMYLAVDAKHELTVDTSRGSKLQININVSFPRLQCAILSLDTMDISGEQQLDVVHTIYKQRLAPDGSPMGDQEREEDLNSKKPNATTDAGNATAECGTCYGAGDAGQCCNTCDDVREAYRRRGWAFANVQGIEQCEKEGFMKRLAEQRNEGCLIHGRLEVNRVAGNFHIAPGKSFEQAHMHVHDLMPFSSAEYNVSHVVHHLSFGTYFPGRVNPLDAVAKTTAVSSGLFQYFLKVVPTTYAYTAGSTVVTNQYSVTEHFRAFDAAGGHRGLPGVFFFYEISPIMVQFTETSQPFLHFLTSVCAIVGGVFTVSGILDSIIYNTHRIAKKMELGKLS